MTTYEILLVLAGLALFLFGVHMMGTGLEIAAGNKIKELFSKSSSNRIVGVLTGALFTAIIQSSSATIVMVIGFVNSGLLTLNQAVWIILGANIGTTITAQFIALDITSVALAFAFIGIIIYLYSKNDIARHIASVFTGFGVLFIGMDMMGTAVEHIQFSSLFQTLLGMIENPFAAILFGTGATAIIQSSSASIGITQSIAAVGAIPFACSVFLILGANIGTCFSAIFSTVGAKTNAKRVVIIHFVFNIIGVIIFAIICMTTPFISWTESLSTNPAAQIAHVHSIFNIVTAIILLPFGNLLEKCSVKLLPEKEVPETPNRVLEYIEPLSNHHSMGYTTIALSQIRMEISRMYQMARGNVEAAYDALLTRDMKALEDIEDCEGYIDFLNKEISQHIVSLMPAELSEKDSQLLNSFYTIIRQIERIGDHAMNIAEYLNRMQKWSVYFPESILSEIEKMKELNMTVLNNIDFSGTVDSHILLFETTKYEAMIDEMQEKYLKRQLKRIRKEDTKPEVGILYSEILTDFERLGDYALNLAEIYKKMS